MLVGERMSRHPITVEPKTSVVEALNLIRNEKVRRLPVLSKDGSLIGIVSEKDLLYASPSPATSLSVWEINYLLSKLTVAEVMKREVITVGENEVLEVAARIMADKRIGSLPVMRGNQLVGIITETDLFKVFVELFSARSKGVRISALIPAVKGELARITGAVAGRGGNILAMGTFLGEDPTNARITMKVDGVPMAELVELITPLVQKMLDVREV
jgi:acetoin utilization protein AcuB